MSKPITLSIPHYFNEQIIANNRLVFSKSKPLLEAENNQVKCIVSLEQLQDYVCTTEEIGEEYQQIATHCFQRDRENGWALPIQVSNCSVYSYGWRDDAFHFQMYWILISEFYMLQLVGFFEPPFSDFYKNHLATYFQATEINTSFQFSSTQALDELIAINRIDSNQAQLQQLMNSEHEKKERAAFLKEHLVATNPKFYQVLEDELSNGATVSVKNFVCTDWNMYYNLFNPENFSDPDSSDEWANNADVYEFYETPYTSNQEIEMGHEGDEFRFSLLKAMVSNLDKVEDGLLSFFEEYTFGNGGAYADAKHFNWARIELERFHGKALTQREFLKRNLCLERVVFFENDDKVEFYFHCSWDTEHGIVVEMNEDFKCKTAD